MAGRALIAAALVCAGCAGPQVKIETVEVPVPVMVPCAVAAPLEPRWATADLRAEADIYEKVKALLAEIEQRKGYEVLLKAASSGCVQQQSTKGVKP